MIRIVGIPSQNEQAQAADLGGPSVHAAVACLKELQERRAERRGGALEQRGEVLRIPRPVDVVHEAGAIADLLVKNDGPAVIFEQPR